MSDQPTTSSDAVIYSLTDATVRHLLSEVDRLLAENVRLTNRLLWRNGNADELAKLLSLAVECAQADHHAHGDGPSGGFKGRVENAQRAQELGLNALEALTELRAQLAQAEQERDRWLADFHAKDAR